MLRKNDEYVKNVDGKYKKLTEDQKKQIAQQNAWINSTIANNLKALALQLEQIQREQAANSLRLQRETQTGAVNPTPIAENAPKNTETTSYNKCNCYKRCFSDGSLISRRKRTYEAKS